MEGILFKWTNYYNGWQPRYFVLNDKGILSYYKSKDLIDQGCKGSSLVNACELKVHPSDPLRFDLIIPGEQFFSLKAKNQSERQQWLLAIGACKAKGNPSTSQRTNSNPLDQELKMKIQELHLYQTVLTQGIHTLKSSINDRPVVDVKDMDQSRMMLGVTCDAFIQTLDECVKLANGNSSSLTVKSRRSRSSSASIEKVPSSSSPSSTPAMLHSDEKHFRTFFSEISSTSTFPRRFGHFASLPLTQIHSELFLTICEEYFSLLEKFSSPTFIPLKADIHSNISKIRRKISIDPKKFESLASIVNDEILSNSNKEKNSATDALLWLTRNLQFLQFFFFEFGQKNCSVEEAMNKAYGHSLKPFHGWITRGIFSIAFRSVPYNEDFLRSLSNETNPIDDPRLEKQISAEMLEHSEEMKVLVEKIFQFYFEKKIFSNEIIG